MVVEVPADEVMKTRCVADVHEDPLIAEMLTDEKFITLLANNKPFRDAYVMQFSCAILAIVYWFYVGVKTGLFIKEEA